MAVPASFSAALEAASEGIASASGQDASSVDPGTTLPGTDGAGMAPGQPTGEPPQDSNLLPGIEGEQPADETKPQAQEEKSGEVPVGTKFDLQVQSELVIGELDGKPLTAGELKNGYMRYSDYTQKNQEFSEYRTTAEPCVEFVTQNADILQKIASGDPNQVREALLTVAQAHGVDFSEASAPMRDPATGRFVAQTSADDGINLEEIAEEFGEDSVPYRMALAQQAATQQIAELKAALGQMVDGAKQTASAVQAKSQVEALAGQWSEKGVEGIDTGKAAALVGQPMTPIQALQVAAFTNVVKWYASKQASRPWEPGGRGSGSDLSKISLSQAIQERIGR